LQGNWVNDMLMRGLKPCPTSLAVLSSFAVVLIALPPLDALTITRGPYLQDVAGDGVTVRWETDVAASGTVRIGTASPPDGTVTDPALTLSHEIGVGGLLPGTRYVYRVESDDGTGPVSSEEYSFVTAPAAGGAFRFVAVSDTQQGATWGTVSEAIRARGPDFLFHAGDLQNDDPSLPASWDSGFFGPGRELLARVPFYAAIGNHEYPGGAATSVPRLFLDDFSLPGDERDYSFDYGPAHFVALDSFATSAAGWSLSSAQRAWLEADLAAHVGARWTFVFFHHPLYNSSSSTDRPWQAPLRAELVPLFEAYGVDFVVSGHEHLYCRSERNGITYITTGGGGGSLITLSATPFTVNPHHHRLAVAAYHYLTFDVSEKRVELVALRTDGTEIDRTWKSNVRRNVILFIGDGLGPEQLQAGRLHRNGTDSIPLILEDPARMPHAATVKTLLPAGGVPDSANTATAMATGHKAAANGSIAEDGGKIWTTILELARDDGRRTGLLTNGIIIEATPASFGAHDGSRSDLSALKLDYIADDDATRLDGDHPGSFPSVIFGGGNLGSSGIDAAYRTLAGAAGYTVLADLQGLLDLDPSAAVRVLGTFDQHLGNGQMAYAYDRIRLGYSDEPALASMVERALAVLEREPRGFFLLVEDELIDPIGHGGVSPRNDYLGPEVGALDDAVRAVLDWADANGEGSNTLVLVTGDHETGGLSVPDGQAIAPGSTPAMTFASAGHTGVDVPIQANWPAGLAGLRIDNTEVFHLMADFLYGGRAPVISGVTVGSLTFRSAVISWSTDEPSDGSVEFGATDDLGWTIGEASGSRTTVHSVTLGDLQPSTTYSFRITSGDIAGYVRETGLATFTTPGAPLSAPTGLAVADLGSSLPLDWNDNPEASLASYNVYASSAPGGPYEGLNADEVLVAAGSEWSYDDSGANLGGAWTALEYDDSGWKSGPAELGFGDGDEETVISYGSDSNAKYPTSYFRRRFSVSAPSLFEGLTLRLLRDDGAVVSLNGIEVARSNMPAGTILYTTLASTAIGTPAESTFFESSLPTDALVPGENVIAVEVHQGSATSTDFSFDLELLARGRRIVESGFVDAGAPLGDNRYYVVTAVDTAGAEGPASEEVCGSAGAPGAPGGLAAARGDGRVTLSWTPPGDCDIAGYLVYRSTVAGGPFIPLTVDPAPGASSIDTGVTNGTTYHYVVQAVDAAGHPGPVSGEASATPSEMAAPEISAISAVPGSVTARIAWTTDEPSNSRVDFGFTTDHGLTAVAPDLVLSHDMLLDDLVPGTTYHYRVSSSDIWGNMGSGADLTFTTLPDPTPPVISALNVAEVTDRTARIAWMTDDPAGSRVEYGLNSLYGSVEELPARTRVHSVHLRGLTPAATFHFRVLSRDAAGNTSVSGDRTFTTLADTFPPAAPTGLVAVPGDGQVTLDWSDGGEPDMVGYFVYRSETSGGGYLRIVASPLAASEHRDGTAENGRTYFYVVTAIDLAGNEGPPSPEVQGVPRDEIPPVPPAGLIATAGEGEVLLDWADNSELDLAGYNLYRSVASGGPYDLVNPGLLPSSDAADGGLTNGTAYFYVVTAVNIPGKESAPSEEVSAAPQDLVPPPPAALWAIEGGSGIDLSWPASPAEDVDGYKVYRSDTAGGPYTALNADEVLVASGSAWKYLDDGADPASGWSSNGFDDSAWMSGSAELGYGDGDEVTTISYGPDSAAKYISYYFRKTFPVSDPAAYSGLKVRIQVDDGAVIYLNGDEVARTNMPAGAIGPSALAASAIYGTAETAYVELPVDRAFLFSGENLISVEVHQAAADSTDIGFDLELLGIGDLVRATAFVDGAASPGTDCHYVVTAVDLSGLEGAYSPEVCVAPGAPDEPASVVASDTSRAVELSWLPSAACDVRGYDIYRSMEPGAGKDRINYQPVSDTTYADKSVVSRVTYYYSIAAVDWSGNASPLSYEVSVVHVDLEPPIVGDVEVIEITSTSGLVLWSTDELAASVVEFGPYPEYGDSRSDPMLATAHAVLLDGLSPRTLYGVRVASTDAAGNRSAWSEVAFETLRIPAADFLRGDSNGDRRLDISDAIWTLAYLFQGGSDPWCDDAADTNDDGKVDISDPISFLGFTFFGGAQPRPPYPDSGQDPTPDGLEDCSA
jgi:alkaline phosphatase/fibronectin type 3 domain-containing protein